MLQLKPNLNEKIIERLFWDLNLSTHPMIPQNSPLLQTAEKEDDMLYFPKTYLITFVNSVFILAKDFLVQLYYTLVIL